MPGILSKGHATTPYTPTSETQPRSRRQTESSTRSTARWDQILAKFEIKEQEVRGLHRCGLNDF
jgi:hypothetical protein